MHRLSQRKPCACLGRCQMPAAPCVVQEASLLRLQQQRQFTAAVALMSTALRLAGLVPGAAMARSTAAAAPSAGDGPAESSGLEPGVEPPALPAQQPQDLFGLLMEAADVPADAAAGLTAEASAAFLALLPQLDSAEQQQKVGQGSPAAVLVSGRLASACSADLAAVCCAVC